MHQLMPQTCVRPSSLKPLGEAVNKHSSPPLLRERMFLSITMNAAMARFGSGNDRPSSLHSVFPVAMSTQTSLAGSPSP